MNGLNTTLCMLLPIRITTVSYFHALPLCTVEYIVVKVLMQRNLIPVFYNFIVKNMIVKLFNTYFTKFC